MWIYIELNELLTESYNKVKSDCDYDCDWLVFHSFFSFHSASFLFGWLCVDLEFIIVSNSRHEFAILPFRYWFNYIWFNQRATEKKKTPTSKRIAVACIVYAKCVVERFAPNLYLWLPLSSTSIVLKWNKKKATTKCSTINYYVISNKGDPKSEMCVIYHKNYVATGPLVGDEQYFSKLQTIYRVQ